MGPLLPTSGRAQGGRGHQLRRVEVHATQVEEEGGVLIDAVGNLVHQSRQMLARLAGTAALRAKGAPSSEVGARALAIKDRKEIPRHDDYIIRVALQEYLFGRVLVAEGLHLAQIPRRKRVERQACFVRWHLRMEASIIRSVNISSNRALAALNSGAELGDLSGVKP